MKDIFAPRLYRRVARLGGFSGAARECELSQSQASRIIADLESDLGTRLLSRGTRAVVPTAAFPTNDIGNTRRFAQIASTRSRSAWKARADHRSASHLLEQMT
jgi:Bacterial regulatory helix-turn-helix protein, lysR family